MDTGTNTLQLGMRDKHPFALAVREGFWESDCGIDANLTTGQQGGIAFLVQDKNNYCFIAPASDSSMNLWIVSNGVPTAVSATVPGSAVNWTLPHRWLIRVSGTDLDLAVQADGTWREVFSNEDNGLDVLSSAPDSGAVGLATNNIAGNAIACSSFGYGYASESWVPGVDDQLFLVKLVTDTFTSACLAVPPTYDSAGNLTDDGLYQYAYDAWNRLVEVRRHTTDAPPGSPQRLVATYSYDGLGHRIYKHVENSGDMNREDYFYYNNRWQLLEIDNAAGVARQQFVWGTNYIDEAVCMDVDTDTNPEAEGYGDCTDSGGSRHFFYMQDANWNVVGLWENTTSGPLIVERYEYDPYGTVRIYRGSASAGAAEQRTVAGQSLKWLNASLPSNPILYCGYFHDNETGLNHVRNRMCSKRIGRWMQKDPVGYRDGRNLYEYVRSSPLSLADPLGLWTKEKPEIPSCCSQVNVKWTADWTIKYAAMVTFGTYVWGKFDAVGSDDTCIYRMRGSGDGGGDGITFGIGYFTHSFHVEDVPAPVWPLGLGNEVTQITRGTGFSFWGPVSLSRTESFCGIYFVRTEWFNMGGFNLTVGGITWWKINNVEYEVGVKPTAIPKPAK